MHIAKSRKSITIWLPLSGQFHHHWLSKIINWLIKMAFFCLNLIYLNDTNIQFSSVAQSCPTLSNSMDCIMPGLPVHDQLPELTQTHVHRIGDAIQWMISSSVIPFSSHLQSFPASDSFFFLILFLNFTILY